MYLSVACLRLRIILNILDALAARAVALQDGLSRFCHPQPQTNALNPLAQACEGLSCRISPNSPRTLRRAGQSGSGACAQRVRVE